MRRAPAWWRAPAATAALALVAVLTMVRAGHSPVPAVTGPTVVPMRPAAPDTASAPAASAASGAPAALPPVGSWEGTDVAGDMHRDAAGRIVPDEDLRELFDYLLSADTVLSLAQIHQRLAAIGRAHGLDPAQQAQLDDMFSRYTVYLRQAAALHAGSDDPAQLRRLLDARLALRRKLLGPAMAQGLFARSDAQDRYQLAVIELMKEPGLSAEARRQRLEQLQAQAPPEVQAARAPSRRLEELADRTAALRKAGADPAQIQALRIEMVGAQAAARMQTVDEYNADWNQRMQTLEAERQQIVDDPGIAQSDKPRAIEDLVEREFSGPDAVRARALLSLAGPPPPASP